MIEKVDRTYEWDCQYQNLRLILNKNYKSSKGSFSTTQFPFKENTGGFPLMREEYHLISFYIHVMS